MYIYICVYINIHIFQGHIDNNDEDYNRSYGAINLRSDRISPLKSIDNGTKIHTNNTKNCSDNNTMNGKKIKVNDGLPLFDADSSAVINEMPRYIYTYTYVCILIHMYAYIPL
jgi:hypothetical protein